MLFDIALFSSLLVASVVLAVPSGLGTRIRCSGGTRSLNNPLGEDSLASNTMYSHDWAGAVWLKDNGTFNFVTGTFTVPTPSGSIGSSASVWVGIDGDTCQSAILQTGIAFTVESGPPTYFAWYEWYPDDNYNFTGPISISSGDVVRLTVVALSANSGVAMIENLTNGQNVTQNLNSSAPLCGQDAEWIVEDFYDDNDNQVPFANFSTITFTGAVATGPGNETYTPHNAAIYDIKQNGTVLTNVSINGESVTIEYV